MRIAISDYDGTLAIDRAVPEKSLAAIRRWRAAGNLFGIATGRDLVMTIHETERWNIPFDFLVCLTGAAVYDADLSLLAGRSLDDGVIPEVLRHPAALASVHYQLMDDDVLRLFFRGDGSWFRELGTPYVPVDLEQALAERGLRQIGLAYPDARECAEWTERLAADFGDRVAAHRNGRCIDIAPAGVDKATGIAELLAAKKWREEDLLVIGDGENDLPMIRRYRGCCIAHAVPETHLAARRAYADVGEMLDAEARF